MSALVQWWDEIDSGARTRYAPLDALWDAAAKEAADEDYERNVAAPQRAYLEVVRQRGKKKRASRPAKWERDLALMAAETNDGP